MNTEEFLDLLLAAGIEFFAGVPDSTLASILVAARKRLGKEAYVTCANEGNAVACAAGYSLTTGKGSCVYMQNSGLGNALNPLLSLTHPHVYDIPLLLLIGWRGAPGLVDEPQHQPTGEATLNMLRLAGIEVLLLNNQDDLKKESLGDFLHKNSSRSRALLVTPHIFPFDMETKTPAFQSLLTGKEALATALKSLPNNTPVISSTGFISRQIYSLRQENNQDTDSDFFNVGAMGHVSQIALGAALGQKDKLIVCIDGDGSALMHLGGLAAIGYANPTNLLHIILNNGIHESVGGQSTCSPDLSFCSLAEKLGYSRFEQCCTNEELEKFFHHYLSTAPAGSTLLEIMIRPGQAARLPRPDHNFAARGRLFSNKLQAPAAF